MVVMTPSDESECRRMLATGVSLNQPSAVRYPRGNGSRLTAEVDERPLPIGRGRIVRDAHGRRRPRVAIHPFGHMVPPATEAAEITDAVGAGLRFVKPPHAEIRH